MKLKPGKEKRARWRSDLGFDVWARCAPSADGKAREVLCDRFISEAIEANGLVCAGGVFGPAANGDQLHVVVLKEREYTSCSNRDRGRVERWLRSQAGIIEHRVGELTPTEEDYYDLDRRPTSLPRAPGKTELERANWLRQQAITSYREAVEVLGSSEVREAVAKLERSVRLAEAAVDEVAGPLIRKFGLPIEKSDPGGRLSDLQNFLHWDLGDQRSHRRGWRGSWLKTPLERALFDIDQLDEYETGIIHIPDMHEFERKLVRGSRVAIEEIQELLDVSPQSAVGKQLAGVAATRRKRDAKHEAARKKKPEWPKTQAALFTAARSVRAKAVVGDDQVERTIIPARLAKACGAQVLQDEVPVFLKKADERGYTDHDRSEWIGAHPALLWVSVPNTSWKAPVLAAVVPTNRCKIPCVGKDWLDDAVYRRHERKMEDE